MAMVESEVGSDKQAVIDQMAGFKDYLEGQRLRTMVTMSEIAGRTGDSEKYGAQFQSYQTLHAEKAAKGRLKGEALQAYNRVTNELEIAFGFGDPGLPQVYVLWLNTERVRNDQVIQPQEQSA